MQSGLHKKLISWFGRFFGKKSKTFPLCFIKDDKGHCLPYVFKPAAKPGCPLLVILHGNDNNKNPGGFASPEYNVLMPLDQYGYRKKGSWFLGENGDFFVLDLCRRLIDEYRKKTQIKDELYIWGTSMGGFAALLLGLKLEAHAVFCHIPQTNLQNTRWYWKNKTFIDFIFGADGGKHPYRDIVGLFRAHEGFLPLIFFSFNRFDRPFYNEENLAPMVRALEDKGANYFLIVHPQKGHQLYQKIADHIAFFSFYRHEIEENFASQKKN